jgi:mannose-1-phosphate guanylyltransferase/mannose-6-phosphate isomerase-like protein (cupin superfamily)
LIIVPVILAGGTGSRLWPLSRSAYPKQLLPLVSGKTMLQETLLRIQAIPEIQSKKATPEIQQSQAILPQIQSKVIPEIKHSQAMQSEMQSKVIPEIQHSQAMQSEMQSKVIPEIKHSQAMQSEMQSKVIPEIQHSQAMQAEMQSKVIPEIQHSQAMQAEMQFKVIPEIKHFQAMQPEMQFKVIPEIQRSQAILEIQSPIVICNEEHRFLVAEQLKEIGIQGATIILEPIGRGTAPAAAIAALYLRKYYDTDPILFILPADHVIQDQQNLMTAIQTAALNAAHGQLVTFGVKPTYPETSYGYIRTAHDRNAAQENAAQETATQETADRETAAQETAAQENAAQENAVQETAIQETADRETAAQETAAQETAAQDRNENHAYPVVQFVEKPNQETARQYLASGQYYWNSGMFMFHVSDFLKELEQYAPDIRHACDAAMIGMTNDFDFVRLDQNTFAACPANSIDYAIMEHTKQAVLVPLNAFWSDVGSWTALWEAQTADQDGNVLQGDVFTEQVSNSYLRAESRMLAVVGVSDHIVVETQDAVLVAHKNNSQAVKNMVEKLKKNQRTETDIHRKVYRPWGHYETVDKGEFFQVKRITVKPGASLSLQMHHYRSEHWIVVSGIAAVTKGEEVFSIKANESTYIPQGMKHRLTNEGKDNLELIEVQSGTYLGEDDIVRFEDVYGRVT